MNALDIISLPGHPGMFARRVAVQAWQSAGSPPVNSAGRLYAEQKRLYDGWKDRTPGFSPADNPDDESLPLAHVRFVAFDIDPTNDRIRKLSEAGFRRPYTYEPWHWELPNVRSYALVRSIPSTASLDPTPVAPPIEKEDDMMKPELVQRNENGDEYSLVAPWMTKPGDSLQQGYIVLANEAQAKAAARLYGTGFGNHTKVNRADYIEIQKLARIARTQWLAAQPKPTASGSPAPTASEVATEVIRQMKLPGN